MVKKHRTSKERMTEGFESGTVFFCDGWSYVPYLKYRTQQFFHS